MKRLLPCLTVLCFGAFHGLRADTARLELAVNAGKHDRTNVPVRVLVPLNAKLHNARSITVQTPDGQTLPAQLTAPGLAGAEAKPQSTRELHFIVPQLSAGKSLTCKAVVSTDGGPKREEFAWHDRAGEHAELRFGSRPVLRYLYQALDESSKERRDRTFKVFHHLFDPAGERLVTNGAGGKFPHHRGLFYGFNRISYGPENKKADIWHCTGDTYQEHQLFLRSEAGPVLGRHLIRIGWHGVKKELFAVERREVTVYNVPGGQLVEFRSQLESAISPVKLDGDPQHAGFHFRADNEVASKTSKQTYYLRPDGPGKPGETRNWEPKTRQGPVNLPWDAMSFVLDGKRYTAVYLDRPQNPKEARFSERDYGRFGSYFEYEVTPERPLNVAYRIWLQEGEMTVPQAAAHSANFVAPVEVTLR